MLKIAKVELKLISGADMYLSFEKGMRGRVSYISKRCRPYHKYGYAMPKHFLTSGFKRIYPKEFDSNKYSRNNSKGWALEVDLEYRKKLRELHNDYSLAPDKVEMMSNYHSKIADFYIPIGTVKNIGSNFFDKEKNVLLYENLQLCLGLRLKLNKIHSILEFN